MGQSTYRFQCSCVLGNACLLAILENYLHSLQVGYFPQHGGTFQSSNETRPQNVLVAVQSGVFRLDTV